MAEKFRYTCQEPARLLFSSITEKSAPPNTNAEPAYSGKFGLGEKDFKAICTLMVKAIESEMGSFSGKAGDYYMSCISSAKAIELENAKADFNSHGKTDEEKFKIQERAASNCKLYGEYAGILTAKSKFPVALSKVDGGKIVDLDISQAHVVASAGKDLFYRGAYVAPCVEFQGYKRKSIESKDGVTSFLKQVLFVRKGQALGGGGAPSGNETFSSFAGYSDVDPTAMAPEGDESDF